MATVMDKQTEIDMIQPRRAVAALSQYTPPLEGRRGKIRLDFNENTVGDVMLTAYPEYDAFIAKLAKHYNLPPDEVLITNGSDEALFVISFTLIEPNEDVAICSRPAFPLIPHYLKLVQGKLTEIPMTDDMQFDLSEIEKALEKNPKLAIFASPDNPTGASISTEVVQRWCQLYPKTMFVIDEAYYEYAPNSAESLLGQFDNLMITRTFSKAWGLAGLRLGVVLGPKRWIEYMKRVRSPYSVNTMALEKATELLPNYAQVLADAKDTMKRKERVIAKVQEMGYRVIPGNGNFFLMAVGVGSNAFCKFSSERGVLVRDRSSMFKLWGFVRVSIGTDAELDKFIACVEEFRQQFVLMFDMDGTLIDTSKSFDETIFKLASEYSDKPVSAEELKTLRGEGGFNDDWDATVELLKRRGVEETYKEIAQKALPIYLELAKQHETWLSDPQILDALKKRYRLAVVTGRCRAEYDSIWGEQFKPYFEAIFCQDDIANAKGKPAPDLLVGALKALKASDGVYVGNSVDDMQAAKATGIARIAVTTTHGRDVLVPAGAEYVCDSLEELGGLLLP